jgi:hypothetical protein
VYYASIEEYIIGETCLLFANIFETVPDYACSVAENARAAVAGAVAVSKFS